MLRGTLEDFALPEVLRLLSSAKKTGRLDITRRAGTGSISFRGGEIVDADTELSSSLLGQKLVRSGAITELQLRRALDEQAASGDRLGRILLTSKVLDEVDLENSLRGQIEDAVFELLCWETGEFSWTEVDPEPTEVEISLAVENLVLEVSRRLQERELVLRKITSPDVICRMATHPPDGAERINISAEEWRVLVLVDGRRSVAEIAASVGAAEFDTMRILYGLASAGLIEADLDAPPPGEVHPPPRTEPMSPEPPPTVPTGPPPAARPRAEPPRPTAPAFSGSEAGFPSAAEEWFADPELATAGGPEAAPAQQNDHVELADADLPPVDRAAAVRELSGIADEPRPPKTPPPPPASRAPSDESDRGDERDRGRTSWPSPRSQTE